MNNNRIVVTGVNGFIGTAMIEYISKEYPAAEIISIRRSDFPNIQTILKDTRPDYILHLAGYAGSDWQALYESNILTSIQLFESCISAGLKPRIVIPGSAAQYGTYENDYQIKEDSPQYPISNYGECKKWQCSLSYFYFKRGLPIVIGNIFNIISNNIPEGTVVGDLISKVRELKSNGNTDPLTIGNLQSFRDFLHIADICKALIVLSCKGKPGESYNICSGNAVSIGKILQLMCSNASVSPEINYDPACEQKVNYNYGSNRKITAQLGWEPDISLEKSVQLLYF
jgi:GDP-4-dehydro-6-deoxy-D-mannose reductase